LPNGTTVDNGELWPVSLSRLLDGAAARRWLKHWKLGVRTTDRDAGLGDGEATGLPDEAQERCGPGTDALGKFMVMSTAIR